MSRIITINIVMLSTLFILMGSNSLLGQTAEQKSKREHLIGISYGINNSGLIINPERDNNSRIYTLKNFSLFYTNYHGIWSGNHYFGLKTGLSYIEQGFRLEDTETKMEVISIPFISQFHYDTKWVRILLNLGGYAGYRLSKYNTIFYDNDIQREKVMFVNNEYRYDFGAIGGGGVAVRLHPFEIHLECNYHISMSYLWNPRREKIQQREFTFPNQLIFSVGVLIHLN